MVGDSQALALMHALMCFLAEFVVDKHARAGPLGNDPALTRQLSDPNGHTLQPHCFKLARGTQICHIRCVVAAGAHGEQGGWRCIACIALPALHCLPRRRHVRLHWMEVEMPL